MLFVVTLLYVGIFSWVCGEKPYCSESNTYEYTSKCADIIEVETYTTRGGHSYIWKLHFNDGEVISLPESIFDTADKNDLIGKDMTFRIYEKDGSRGKIIAEISDEDGNKYLTFEEYNKTADEVRIMFTVIAVFVFLIISIGAVSLWYDF